MMTLSVICSPLSVKMKLLPGIGGSILLNAWLTNDKSISKATTPFVNSSLSKKGSETDTILLVEM
ncbi:hypothetical protein GCM10011445_12490 [Pseudocitrobacter faecalis]|nr:hypothetical protein GCM10011445_12490 [Pseudocitrobacter faecalis]